MIKQRQMIDQTEDDLRIRRAALRLAKMWAKGPVAFNGETFDFRVSEDDYVLGGRGSGGALVADNIQWLGSMIPLPSGRSDLVGRRMRAQMGQAQVPAGLALRFYLEVQRIVDEN